jgi:flavin reductase (DIM6/NTAB) family NADH-FMN oxidoreductase RutF
MTKLEAQPAANPRPAIDPSLFRKTMGGFATGVTVITVEVGGATHGMTANAFMSGSLEPPLCVVSVAKRARTHAMLIEAGAFGVSVLAADQQSLALFFAGRSPVEVVPRFEIVAGTPLLRDCVARIAARLANRCDCGDHTLFIGAIQHMEATGRAPLLYHRGAFGQMAPRRSEAIAVPEFW